MGLSASESQISSDSTVVATHDSISCDLDGEAVILNVESGVYFGLDPVGARIWNLIQEPRRINDLRETLMAEYDVDADRCESSILTLLRDMADHGLIEVEHGIDS